MEFETEFYEDENGNSPIDEFLDDLRRRERTLLGPTINGITKLENRQNHGEPLTKPVGDGLFELRVGHKDTARVLWFFTTGRKIVLVHGFVKKGRDLPENHRQIALKRRTDYLRRFPEP